MSHGTAGQTCCSCPGTKGQRDKDILFVPEQRDNGTSSKSYHGPGQPLKIWDRTRDGTITIFLVQPWWRRSFRMRRQKSVMICLPLVSRSNPGGAAFANCILGVALSKLRKRNSTCRVSRLSLTTPAGGMKALAQIGAWHNSLNRMPAVILVSPLLNYFNY